jgi:TolA-binding protein
MKTILTIIFCTLSCSTLAWADNSSFTPGEVQLNAQIQAQIKNLQEQQQQQLATLNSQLQAQIQKVQSDLEKEIQLSNNQVQGQLKQLQTQISAKH